MNNQQKIYIQDFDGVFPGANSIDEYWRLLEEGRTAPLMDLKEYWGGAQDINTDELSIRVGHLIDKKVDSKFPRQIALARDVLSSLRARLSSGSKVGLVVATEWTDPSFYLAEVNQLAQEDSYNVQTQVHTLAEFLGIDSSCVVAVDTACASALYAVNIARTWLTDNNFDEVIVLGLNAYLHQFLYRGFSKLGALSTQKKLASFSVNADGIVPGEAVCGVTFGKDFNRAIAEVSGIGLTSDGREGSAFSPGLQGQLSAYRKAFEESGLSPDQISYVETHGTATKLGDQTELQSLTTFFETHKRQSPLYVGASKTNIGHTLAASGLAALIKSALMIKHKKFAPLHIQESSILDDCAHLGALSQAQNVTSRSMHIGISSFGFGGSNAHLILSSPSKRKDLKTSVTQERKLYVYALSHKNEDQLLLPPKSLKGIPMGPKMQQRIDRFQRHAIDMAYPLIEKFKSWGGGPQQLSCVFMNNLGGNLSVEFERKYQNKTQDGPELTLEAIASTLPSMLSGYLAQMYDIRAGHELLSADKEGLFLALDILTSQLGEQKRPVLFGLGHGRFSQYDRDQENMTIMLVSTSPELFGQKPRSVIQVKRQKNTTTDEFVKMGEVTGLDELNRALLFSDKQQYKIRSSNFTLDIETMSGFKDESHKARMIEKESKLHKEVALQYLELLASLQEEKRTENQDRFGEALKNLVFSGDKLSAELSVPENHRYFYDHPLDHVPGIAVIYGIEELMEWKRQRAFYPSSISLKFKKFIEKNLPCRLDIKLGDKNHDVQIIQDAKLLGEVRVGEKAILGPEQGEAILSSYALEDKKITHKHIDQNVLVSALNPDRESCSALPLEYLRHDFFIGLMHKRPSLLYYLEVTRQFVMLLAHLVKKIPLESKMNLISVDVDIERWIIPPFEMRLLSFAIQEVKDFSYASIDIEYYCKGVKFGGGRIKAQVVDKEYYLKQRQRN